MEEIFDQLKNEIPENKVLIPGVLDTTSNFVEHSSLVKQRIEKFVNIDKFDGPGSGLGYTLRKTKDLIVVGKGNSNLDQVLEFAAKQDRKYLVPNPSPEKGFYYRSDHFPFAKIIS